MILFRSIFSELIIPFFLTFGVMSFILTMQHIYRLVPLMVEKSFAVTDVGLMLFYLLPQTFSVTIPLGVVGAVFITVIRQSIDSEIICMRAAGKSLWRYSLPFLFFGLLATIVAGGITLWLQAIGYRAYSDLQLKMVKLHADENIVPGKFNYEFGNKVIQVGGRLPTNEVTDIFIADKQLTPSSAIITASRGLIDVEEESKQVYFRLQEGAVYIPDGRQATFRTVEFAHLDYLLELEPRSTVSINRLKRTTTIELVKLVLSSAKGSRGYSRAILELNYRLTLPWACLVFVLAAIPMAMVDPRSGKSGSFLRAIFLVLTYYIIWIGFKDLVQSGNAPAWVLWLPLLLILSYGLFRLWQVNNDTSLSALLFPRKKGAS